MTAGVETSVIVPVYQGARLLPLAMESLRAQTMPPREVIVVDDGSSDGSAEVAARLGAALPCDFVLVRQENAGLAAAMNAGLARARGSWLLELDADDYLVPDAIAAFQAEAKDGIDVVSSHFDYFRFRRPAWLRGRFVRPVRWPLPDEATQRSLNTVIATSLVRRARVESVGGWERRLTAHQDWDLWLRIWNVGNFAKVDRALVKVHRRPGSMSSDQERMERHRRMVVANWRTRYVGVPVESL